MITEVYAHILDEDRKINAQKFEQAFYTNGDMRMVERQIQQAKAASGELPEQLIQQLESSPKLMDALAGKLMEQYGEQLLAQFAARLIQNKTA